MEHRDDGLLVDFSGAELQDTGKRVGNHPIVFDAKQERELRTLDHETKLMRAMNEMRPYTPSKSQWRAMGEAQRDAFRILRENVFRKHGLQPGEFNL